MKTKQCFKCKETKGADLFYTDNSKSDGLNSLCISCRKEYIACPKRTKQRADCQRRLNYGIEPAVFDKMLSGQNGECAICQVKMVAGKGKHSIHVDHCHDSGAVRALLCHGCNAGMGNFNDNLERILKAAIYLETHKTKELT